MTESSAPESRRALDKKLYYSIGEVAEITQLQPYTLRAWEKEFACLRPRRVRGKNRAYRLRDIGIILLIKRLLYEERYSTRGVRQKLKNEPDLVRTAAEDVAAASYKGLEAQNPEIPSTDVPSPTSPVEADPGQTKNPFPGAANGVRERELREWVAALRADLSGLLKFLS